MLLLPGGSRGESSSSIWAGPAGRTHLRVPWQTCVRWPASATGGTQHLCTCWAVLTLAMFLSKPTWPNTHHRAMSFH